MRIEMAMMMLRIIISRFKMEKGFFLRIMVSVSTVSILKSGLKDVIC
jgi:hypothetical protein